MRRQLRRRGEQGLHGYHPKTIFVIYRFEAINARYRRWAITASYRSGVRFRQASGQTAQTGR
ncbi:hypothetical protein RSSE_c2849 [Ralstonia solanacearum]|nr:hypothetical protein RSSE_c2849 [Ralstonia solanacearum]